MDKKKLDSHEEKLLLQICLSVWQYTSFQDCKVQFLYSLRTEWFYDNLTSCKIPFPSPAHSLNHHVFTCIPFLSNFSLTLYSIPIWCLSTLCLGIMNNFSKSSSESKVSRDIIPLGSFILASKVFRLCLLLHLFWQDIALSYKIMSQL